MFLKLYAKFCSLESKYNTYLKNGSGKVSLVVRNITDGHIFFKKGVVQVVSASPVPPMELLPEMEAAQGTEAQPKSMSVAARQEKLLEKLNVLGKEVKMGPVDLPPEAWEAMNILKGKVQSMPVLVFPDFDKPFLLETDASKEGLGAVLSQKQSDGCYHPVTFRSCSLTPSEKNYHSSKLEFLTLKWSITEHFKEYLAYPPFVV